MNPTRFLLTAALLSALGVTRAMADCQIADAKLEEAILQKPELRGPANRQSVRDLRSLRDAAFTLWSYGRHADCERLLANIRELVAGPAMNTLGDNDEDEADKQMAAREPKVQRGATLGRRDEKDAKPLVAMDELAPGLRARPERGEWGLIGRDGGASRRVLKPDLEVPCGPRLPGGNIAALAFVTKQT
jgi:hypothetical protein